LLLASTLRGVISQRLLERADGHGRVPAIEVMTMNPRVFDRIVEEGQTHTLADVIAESEFYGMQTFDRSILQLFKSGLITFQEALSNASNAHDMRVRAEQAGLVAV
jgi:twitching motility protein PilT